MKRVYCLYRVSTKRQVDQMKDDIPMQRIACHEFADRQDGWVIVKEFLEKGVSGFKVSANDRDVIQELKEAALNHEFDVLLVYMFDRLGRIDKETPFVVEWFVEQGIEVWSSQEGQQKFDDQTDKLMNYIRFWMANGESRKTSMRLKTSTAQRVAAGLYRGGPVMYGHRAVHKGRLNKKGQPVKDLEIDPQAAEHIIDMCNKTLYEGYGSHRLADYLEQKGVRKVNGKKISSAAVLRILRNPLLVGYYCAGDTVSERIPELAILDEEKFNALQEILDQRAEKDKSKRRIAQATQGKTLLSGNIRCAHCGGTLIATQGKDSYSRKDGTIYEKTYIKYMCYHRARKLCDCDGQSIYSAPRIDETVEAIVKNYLEEIKKTPRDKALEIRYKKELSEKRKLKNDLVQKRERLEAELTELSLEVGRTLCGKNVFSADVLSMSIETTKKKIAENDKLLAKCDAELEQKSDVLTKLDFYYRQFISWAEEYDNSTMEQKKMIICQLIDSIKVGRGYNIEIEFNVSYKQFFGEEKENCVFRGEKVV